MNKAAKLQAEAAGASQLVAPEADVPADPRRSVTADYNIQGQQLALEAQATSQAHTEEDIYWGQVAQMQALGQFSQQQDLSAYDMNAFYIDPTASNVTQGPSLPMFDDTPASYGMANQWGWGFNNDLGSDMHDAGVLSLGSSWPTLPGFDGSSSAAYDDEHDRQPPLAASAFRTSSGETVPPERTASSGLASGAAASRLADVRRSMAPHSEVTSSPTPTAIRMSSVRPSSFIGSNITRGVPLKYKNLQSQALRRPHNAVSTARNITVLSSRKRPAEETITTPSVKRTHVVGEGVSSGSDDEIEIVEGGCKAKGTNEPSKNSVRGLSSSRKVLVEHAYRHLRGRIAGRQAFPSSSYELEHFAYESLRDANEELLQKSPGWTSRAPSTYEDQDRDLVALRGSQMRGDMKTMSRNEVVLLKVFPTHKSTDPQVIDAARKTYDGLTTGSAFTRSTSGSMYGAEIIRSVIARVLFAHGDQSIGIVCEKIFQDLMPLPTIALACAAIQCSLDEWKTGVYEPVTFSELVYKPKYDAFLADLTNWSTFTERPGCSHATVQLQRELLAYSRAATGPSAFSASIGNPVAIIGALSAADISRYEANDHWEG
ncbi:hypothetical protein EV121DRAFT_267113 [Schizophyllum commune]